MKARKWDRKRLGAGQRLCQPGEPGKASEEVPFEWGPEPPSPRRQSTAEQRPQCRGPGAGLGRDGVRPTRRVHPPRWSPASKGQVNAREPREPGNDLTGCSDLAGFFCRRVESRKLGK